MTQLGISGTSAGAFPASPVNSVALESPSEPSPTSPHHRQSHNPSKLPSFRFADFHARHTGYSLTLQQREAQNSRTLSPDESDDGALGCHGTPDARGLDPLDVQHIGGGASGGNNNNTTIQSGPASNPDRSINIGNVGITLHDDNNSPPNNTPGSGFGRLRPHLTIRRAQQQSPHHRHHNEQQSQSQYREKHSILEPRKRDHLPTPPTSSTLTETPESLVSPTSSRHRASTLQISPTPEQPMTFTRPASLPQPTRLSRSQNKEIQNVESAPTKTLPDSRRAHTSALSNGNESATGSSRALTSQRRHTDEILPRQSSQSSITENTTKEWAQRQRDLILPKSLQNSTSTDEKRQTVRSRPPLSFHKPSNPSGGSVRVAPIRSFRSSGSRRSFGLDMSSPSMNAGDSSGDDYSHTDANQRDRTLWALEGRDDEFDSPKTSRETKPKETSSDADETMGDVFMKIASEEIPSRATPLVAGNPARVVRSAHRRPLSTNVTPIYQPTSPQRVRRLSDQQETARSRSRQFDDDVVSNITSRGPPYLETRGGASSSHPEDDPRLSRPAGNRYRVSPATPRSLASQDISAENSPYVRRRTASINDSNAGYRTSAYKQSNISVGHARTYNSSPLGPRATDALRHEPQHDVQHGIEGTESTASTTAPSTVWDELDDLKSRIHRLELTGKLPSTSSAAMNNVMEERPLTATNTTMSSSPKQSARSTVAFNDTLSVASTQRETQPVLMSAITRSLPLLSPDVAKALESAASDAVSMLSMMGAAGTPGPISSGASTVGAGGTVTDRQLRRRAEGICRSLTELVLALSEEATLAQSRTATVPVGSTQQPEPTTPTLTKKFPTLPTAHRRGSVTAEPLERPDSIPSPRAMSKLEERRNTLLHTSTSPSPRLAVPPLSPAPASGTQIAAGRKSSLLIGRTRRAATEEPEDSRRSSMLLRSRRAGTEEIDEGRTTAPYYERRDIGGVEEDADSQFRAPSRAATDVNPPRAVSHHFQSPALSQEHSPSSSSSLPRRRIGSLLTPSRLGSALPQNVAPSRRYLERSTPDRETNSVIDKLAEDRGQRHTSTGQYSLLNRTTSLLRRPKRDSTINDLSSSASASGYR